MAIEEYRRAVELQPGYVTAWCAAGGADPQSCLAAPLLLPCRSPDCASVPSLSHRNNMGDALEKERKWK